MMHQSPRRRLGASLPGWLLGRPARRRGRSYLARGRPQQSLENLHQRHDAADIQALARIDPGLDDRRRRQKWLARRSPMSGVMARVIMSMRPRPGGHRRLARCVVGAGEDDVVVNLRIGQEFGRQTLRQRAGQPTRGTGSIGEKHEPWRLRPMHRLVPFEDRPAWLLRRIDDIGDVHRSGVEVAGELGDVAAAERDLLRERPPPSKRGSVRPAADSRTSAASRPAA